MQNGVNMDPTTAKYLFFQVYFYFFMIPHTISKHLAPRTLKTGSLDVTGKGEVAIALTERKPKDIKVWFAAPATVVPCNCPCDEFTFHIIKKGTRWSLIIDWDVVDARSIKWSLYN